MDLSGIRWSSKEYTLQGFVSKFLDSCPTIVKITEGFLGKQEIDSISSSMVIRIHCLYTQKRVIAEYKCGKLFSLPLKLNSLKFLLSQNSNPARVSVIQEPMILEDILSKYNLPIAVHTSKALLFKERGDLKSQNEILTELILKDTYEENFLLGHPIDKGKIYTWEHIMIPMYMTQLKLVVAEGFLNGKPDIWSQICEGLTNKVISEGNISNVTFEEIYLLDKKDLSQQEPRYSTIEPTYIDISELRLNETHQANKEPITVNQKPIVEQVEKTPVNNPQAPKSISSITDIPSDLHCLTVRQVCECLVLLNMGQYVKAFQGAQVDGQFLYDLDKDMMRSCLGMNGLHIAKILKFRNGWRPNLQE